MTWPQPTNSFRAGSMNSNVTSVSYFIHDQGAALRRRANLLSRTASRLTRMDANMSNANPTGDSVMDTNYLMKMLRILSDGDGSDWNQGILHPDLSQECSEVETNPPSPDVDVNQSSGTVLSRSGQNHHVMSILTRLPQQAPHSQEAVLESHVIATRLTELQPDKSTLTYTITDETSQRTNPDNTLTSNQSTAMQQEDTANSGQQVTDKSTQMMTQPRPVVSSSSSTAPVIETEDNDDIHNISFDQLIPFQSYTDESLSADQMILKNVTDALSAAEKTDDKRVLQTGHHSQTSSQTLDQASCPEKSPLTQRPVKQYPEAAADTSAQDFPETSAATLHPQDNLTCKGMTVSYPSPTTDSVGEFELLSPLGTTSLPTPIMNTTSPLSALQNDTADGSLVNATADTTACLTSLATGGAFLEHLSLTSLFDVDMTPEPEIQKAAEEAIDTGSVSPFVKEELKSKIQLKRLRCGQKELRVSFVNKPIGEPSEEEKEKINRRKEMNRKSANQSRLNRQNRVRGLKQFIAKSEKDNGDLKIEIEQLKEETKSLRRKLGIYTAP